MVIFYLFSGNMRTRNNFYGDFTIKIEGLAMKSCSCYQLSSLSIFSTYSRISLRWDQLNFSQK